MGCNESRDDGEIYSYKHLHQKPKKISNHNLTLHVKKLEKEEQSKLKASRRKQIVKSIAEINEIENRQDRDNQ